MTEPPSRAVMHDYGFPDSPKDNNWSQGWCGGKDHQWSPGIGGRCGICGDPWDARVREHEAPGGKFATGVITRNYSPGQQITVTSDITANHLGFVEVQLCRNNDPTQDPDQSCFEQPGAALTFVSTGEDKFWITEDMEGKIESLVQLPNWECDQCILQWTYRNGRDWGTCNGACGKVEHFRACSDISISGSVVVHNTTTPHSTHTPSTHPTPDLTTNLPTPPPGTTCKAVGSWEGNPTQDAWCTENCFHDPPFCPEDICDCQQQEYHIVQANTCRATGVWTGSAAVNTWCNNNCRSSTSFCPSSICDCS